MDISTHAEVVLRRNGYETWHVKSTVGAGVTCFENAALVGFLHVFDTVGALLGEWKARQKTVLQDHADVLRMSGLKAWNVYSVLLTADRAPSYNRAMERIEEDFAFTRKIARASIETPGAVEDALLPLSAIRAQPSLGPADFEARLRARLGDITPNVVEAFLGDASADEVAEILEA